MVPTCLFRRDLSFDVHYAITSILVMLTFLHVYLDLDLRSNFEINLIMSKLAYFDAFCRDKHDGVKGFALSLIDSKLFRKKHALKKMTHFAFNL